MIGAVCVSNLRSKPIKVFYAADSEIERDIALYPMLTIDGQYTDN